MATPNTLVHKLTSALILVTGAVLMAGKIHSDGDPGLIPIALVALGIAWQAATWARIRLARK